MKKPMTPNAEHHPVIRIHSPAKVNLFLHVTGRLPSGYHSIYSLMCPVSLYDEISITHEVSANSISCPHPIVPEDNTNLAMKAALLFFERLKTRKRLSSSPCIHIHIEKKIPVGAGLGGGSSNAAAVITALNKYFDCPFTLKELCSMGLLLGADVPFFIINSPAIARGIGDILKEVSGLRPYTLLIIYPNIFVPTAMIYKNLNLGLTNGKKKLNYSVFSSNNFDLVKNLHNDLESVTLVHYPVIGTIKKLLIEHGASGALMSGSGSSVFGIFKDSKSAIRAYEFLSQNSQWQCYLSHMLV